MTVLRTTSLVGSCLSYQLISYTADLNHEITVNSCAEFLYLPCIKDFNTHSSRK